MYRSIIAAILITGLYSNGYYKGDDIVKEGVYAFYNYDFDRAVEILSEARQKYPEHPGVHLIWAASRWLRAQAYEPIEYTYRILEEDLDEVGPIYDKLVLKFDYDANFKLYQGSALGLSARVSLGKKQWLRTLYRAYKGFTIIEKISERSSDAQLPIGIVEYYAGISNSIFSWTIRLFDLNPSTDSGLQRMAIAADDGHWAWIEAKAILSNLYLWVEDQPILALEHTQDLVKEFPDNFYFNLLYLESIIRTNNISINSTIIEDMKLSLSKLSDRQREWFTPYLQYEMALLAFYQENYSKALELVTSTIENYTAELDIILGNAYLLQGMAYDKLEHRGKAKESYYNCIDLDNFSGSIKRAKVYLEQPYYK